MAREQFAVAELIMNMILGKTEGISRVDFTPQKKKFPFDQPYEQAFERATPESQGISSDYLAKMLRELDASKFTDVHHLLILRHGRVICECNFAPYRSGIWHITHSMCKSITGMAVGMLIDEGKLSLDENIYKIFEGRMSFLAKVFSSEVTVENLLTMTSGVQFNETGMISGNDWLRSYLSAPLAGRPGAEFQYNSLNTYVLSAIVTERTGMTLEEYLRPRLFEPMGITKYFWETCPKGITKGGWGLFLCPEDMAKLGQLYLQKGKWNGVQLVPAEWVELSTKKHVNTGEDTYGYGYQIWMESRPGSFEFNGMLGQNVIVYPDLDMVLVLCAGNNELFQNCVMLNIVRKYFGEEFEQQTSAPKASGTDGGLSSVPGAQATLPENPCAQMLLRRLCAELEMGKTGPIVRKGGWKQGRCRRHGVPDAHSWMKMLGEDKPCGRTYVLSPQNVGLFPLLIQVGHNNMTEESGGSAFPMKKENFLFSLRKAESGIRFWWDLDGQRKPG